MSHRITFWGYQNIYTGRGKKDERQRTGVVGRKDAAYEVAKGQAAATRNRPSDTKRMCQLPDFRPCRQQKAGSHPEPKQRGKGNP